MHKQHNQGIRCSVGECEYNDQQTYCNLSNVKIGCSGMGQAHAEDDTKCASFKTR